jgi:hypothetical protein
VEVYRWNDDAPVARVPKELLRKIGIEGVANQHGELTPEIRHALQLTEPETHNVQAAIDRFVGAYRRLLADQAHPVPPTEQDLRGQSPDNVRVFEVRGIREPATALQQEFLADVGAILDQERLPLLLGALDSWMSSPDQQHGLSSSQAIHYQDHRFQLAHPGIPALTGDEPRIQYGVNIPGRGSFFGILRISDLPEFLRPHVQPWVEAAQAAAVPSSPDSPVP